MKKVLFAFLALPLSLLAQPTLEWSNYPGGVSVATDASNNVFSAWWDYNPAGDIYVNKRNTDGTTLWEVSYNNTDNTRHEVATWIGVDNNNDILVSGTIRSGYASPVNANSLLMKFDQDGNLIWRTVYDTDFDGSSTRKFVIDADNNIYVLGFSSTVTEVRKIDPDGNIVWNYLDSDGIGAPLNIKITPDNLLLISGRWIFGSGGGFSKIDLDGNNIWSKSNFSLTAGDPAGDIFGNTYITEGQYDFDYGSFLTKVSPTGDIIWQVENTMSAFRIEVGNDQYPIISGFPSSGLGGAAFMKYDDAGNVLWENLDADGLGYSLLLHAKMILDDDNNAYLAAGSLFEMNVCKIMADGSFGWVVGISGSSTASDMTRGADNNIYVAGGTIAKIMQEPAEPVCDIPTGLFTNNIAATTARLNWTVVPGAYQYEVWYKKTTAAAWKKKFVPGIKNKLNIKNLQSNKNYVWKIRTICDTSGADLISDFSADQFFTTLILREGTVAAGNQLLLYPNPVKDQLSISYSNIESTQDLMFFIYDTQGRLIRSIKVDGGNNTISINVDELPAGIYQLLFIINDLVETQTFVKQE
ncbi:MAG: T9SS type A sorting domain-containing protein [Chitinophagales bacterium]|nr:T9SS type A sorting domain-containing protein [Chitinophagales bacterium]